MDCILCSAVDSSTNSTSSTTTKVVALIDLGILSGQKFIRSLCQLLDLSSDRFENKFLQPDIGFCPGCTISLSTIWILLDQREQLQKQISEVRGQVKKQIFDALTLTLQSNEEDPSVQQARSSHNLRAEISKGTYQELYSHLVIGLTSFLRSLGHPHMTEKRSLSKGNPITSLTSSFLTIFTNREMTLFVPDRINIRQVRGQGTLEW